MPIPLRGLIARCALIVKYEIHRQSYTHRVMPVRQLHNDRVKKQEVGLPNHIRRYWFQNRLVLAAAHPCDDDPWLIITYHACETSNLCVTITRFPSGKFAAETAGLAHV